MLGMMQEELAARADVPRSAIAAFEAGERNTRRSTLEKLRRALEEAGAIFVEEGGRAGVFVDTQKS